LVLLLLLAVRLQRPALAAGSRAEANPQPLQANHQQQHGARSPGVGPDFWQCCRQLNWKLGQQQARVPLPLLMLLTQEVQQQQQQQQCLIL
jgi:hypothetical protein